MKNIRKTIGLATFAGALAVAPLALGTGTASADSGVNWDAVAACESGHLAGQRWHRLTAQGQPRGADPRRRKRAAVAGPRRVAGLRQARLVT